MNTEIKLVTLKNRLEAQRRKDVNNSYMVNIGGIIKLFKSESAAHRWLKSIGYEMNDDYRTYTKKFKSSDEIELDKKYTIFNPQYTH